MPEDEEKTWCPSCGNFTDKDYCECGFSFTEVLVCPKKNKDDICEVTEDKCLKGMSYEICPFLRTE